MGSVGDSHAGHDVPGAGLTALQAVALPGSPLQDRGREGGGGHAAMGLPRGGGAQQRGWEEGGRSFGSAAHGQHAAEEDGGSSGADAEDAPLLIAGEVSEANSEGVELQPR